MIVHVSQGGVYWQRFNMDGFQDGWKNDEQNEKLLTCIIKLGIEGIS